MKSLLRLMRIGPASVRLMTCLRCSTIVKVSAGLVPLVLLSVIAPGAVAQERTWADSSTPLVYNVENTGAQYQAPNFPDFAHLPIIRPLPDAFRFANGMRDTSFSQWERRRNQIIAAVEKYEIGPKPDCHDCTITASYTAPASGKSTGSLTVNVTRNGKTLTLTSGVYIPQGMGSGPFPILIPMEAAFSFTFNGHTYYFPPAPPPDYASLPASVFQGQPIATVGFVATQVATYSGFASPVDLTHDPFYMMYPELCAGVCSGTSNSGEYAAWAWGVSCLDGSSYTMTIPVPDGSTDIPANSSWVPNPQVWQGSAASPGCHISAETGEMTDAYFSALGHNNGVGNPPLNPGVTSTDMTDPLSVRFGCSANGEKSPESQPMVVNFK